MRVTSFLFAALLSGAAHFSMANITLAPLAGGFSLPVDIANANDASGRLFIVEQAGKIRIIQNGFVLPTPFLDLTGTNSIVSAGGEQGLLGLAFHPQYASNGQFFVYFTANSNAGAGINFGDVVIARYQRSIANPNLADATSRVNLLRIPHSTYQNHNGGALRFGPDGYLYAGVGDGGSGGDPFNSGQSLNTLLGKILRINVTGVLTYTVPATNPFVSTPGALPEIWAYGLRNPWRFSFDRSTGNFYIGDVGQNEWEEINQQTAGANGGANYGWNVCEGNHRYPATLPASNCMPPPNYVAPILEIPNGEAAAITGGYVYRGQSTPDLAGRYVFGTYSPGKLWHSAANGGAYTLIAGLTPQVSTFGEGETGELYLANIGTGMVSSLSSSTDTMPDRVVFPTVNNVSLSSTIESNLVKITGLGAVTPISINGAGGQYTLSTTNSTSCSSSYTTAASIIAGDVYLCVRHTSAGAANTSRTTTLTIGGANVDFVSRTQMGVPVFNVTPSLGPNGFLSPNIVQAVTQGQMAFFSISPAAGFTPVVGGTCGGVLNGTNYTTNPVTADCTVIATFNPVYTVTPTSGVNGTIAPNSVQIVNPDATPIFTITPNAGFTASVAGTCGGVLAGSTFTTNSVTANCTVTAVFTAIPVAPDAPIIGAAVAGDAQANIRFTPPINSGGALITQYTATCNPGNAVASGVASPITVSGLANNTRHTCSVTAANSAGTSVPSATVEVTPISSAILALVAVKSRKTHGSAGPFSVPINIDADINGQLTVEPRMIGSGHTLVFEFNVPITASGTAQAIDASALPIGFATTAASGNDVVVTLTSIADNQRITVTLSDVNAPGFSRAISLGFLVGDVNGTKTVNASDISALKARTTQSLNLSNFQFDLNASGLVDGADITAAKLRSGRSIP